MLLTKILRLLGTAIVAIVALVVVILDQRGVIPIMESVANVAFLIIGVLLTIAFELILFPQKFISKPEKSETVEKEVPKLIDPRFVHLTIHYSQRTDTPETAYPARPRLVVYYEKKKSYWVPTWLEPYIKQHKLNWHTHDGEKALRTWLKKEKIELHETDPSPEDLDLENLLETDRLSVEPTKPQLEEALRTQQELADAKKSLYAHYKAIIGRMRQWDYSPREKGEMVSMQARSWSDTSQGDDVGILLNLEKDKSHLKKFEEVWEIYCDGPKVYSNYARMDEATKTLIRSYLRTPIEKSKLTFKNWTTDRLVEELAEEIINRANSEARRGVSTKPFTAEQPSNESHPRIGAFILEGDFTRAEQLVNILNTIGQKQDVRTKIKERGKALDKVSENKSWFLRSLREKIIEPAKNSDYTDPRLQNGVCDDCKHLKDKLASLTRA